MRILRAREYPDGFRLKILLKEGKEEDVRYNLSFLLAPVPVGETKLAYLTRKREELRRVCQTVLAELEAGVGVPLPIEGEEL